MPMECPGRRGTRNLDSLVLRCPKCGELVEMFNDEQKVRCRCGQTILREAIPSCIQWCPAAERCLGQVIDLREVQKRIAELHGQGKADGYVRQIGDKVRRRDAAGKAGGKTKPGKGRGAP